MRRHAWLAAPRGFQHMLPQQPSKQTATCPFPPDSAIATPVGLLPNLRGGKIPGLPLSEMMSGMTMKTVMFFPPLSTRSGVDGTRVNAL